MPTANSEKRTLTYSQAKKIVDMFSAFCDLNDLWERGDKHQGDEIYISVKGEPCLIENIIELAENGFLEGYFNIHYTDSPEKIKFLRTKDWENEIKQRQTVYVRKYKKDFFLVLDEILRCTEGLCKKTWEPDFFDDIVVFQQKVYDAALGYLGQFVPQNEWETPTEETDKQAKSRETKVYKEFTDWLTKLCEQNREEFKPDDLEHLVIKMEEVFRDALAELKRRNRQSRIVASIEEMENPEVYKEHEVNFKDCAVPARMELSEWNAILTLVRERLQNFFRKNGVTASLHSGVMPDMPFSWLEKYVKEPGKTEYRRPLTDWHHCLTDLKHPRKRTSSVVLGFSTDDSGVDELQEACESEIKYLKSEWKIGQTAECEARLKEMQAAEEKMDLSEINASLKEALAHTEQLQRDIYVQMEKERGLNYRRWYMAKIGDMKAKEIWVWENPTFDLDYFNRLDPESKTRKLNRIYKAISKENEKREGLQDKKGKKK